MSFKSSFTIPTVAAIGFYLIGGTVPAPAYADLGDQLFKLLPNDAAAEEFFGCSVAISGATAIVGAYWDDENGSRSGSAYLFGTSDPANPTQLFKLLPDDGAEGDYFGLSVAISGLTAISGARYDDDNGDLSGSAYLFHTSTGRQIAKLLPDDGAAGDLFGHSVAISGATAIVGAHHDDDHGSNSGSAYLFDTTTGRQIAKLLPDDGAMGDAFGQSVAIGGAPGKEVAIIGAPSDDDNGPSSGVAYVFRFDPETQRWVEEQKLLPADGAGGDRFGWSVAINGATAIIGAIWNDDNGTESGSAYLFDISDPANPVQTAKLLPIDGAALDYFGVSVTLSGDTAIIGARHDDDNGANSGSAYLFDITTGKQITKLLPNDGEAGDKFGGSVAISGATGKVTAIVGARLDDDNGSDSGSAYLFDAAVPGMCPWDIDGSGSVGAADLLSLLASWGPCKGCPADFDHSGNVGASDLLALLANWGPCP